MDRTKEMLVIAIGLLSLLPHDVEAADGAKRVSVLTFLEDHKYAAFERVAQTRAEELLRDAGYEVLDDQEAAKLRAGWVDLADPGHVVTAEEFVERAGKYDIQKIFRVAVTPSVHDVRGMFYTATAAVSLRVLDPDARVNAVSSDRMGTRGAPPSDGLTEGAALANAVQRAVEGAFERAGVAAAAPTMPRSIPLKLEPAPSVGSNTDVDYVASPGKTDWADKAAFSAERWRGEDRACLAISPDRQVGLVGGYAWAINRLGGMSRAYGGRIHLMDIEAGKEFNVYTIHETGKREAGEDGTSAPLACGFLGNWRYAFVATGNVLTCFDVERGMETCRVKLQGAPSELRMGFSRSPTGDAFVVLADGERTQYFHIVGLKARTEVKP